MSKYELQNETHKTSGVTFEESEQALQLQPCLYERLGKEAGIEELSTLFYDRIFPDDDPVMKHIFSSSTRAEAIENQYYFFVQTFGGPHLYQQKKGKYTRLVGRHANYTSIGHSAAERWVHHMTLAMEDHEILRNDEEAKQALKKYFQYTAHYIVVASEYMRPDQVRQH